MKPHVAAFAETEDASPSGRKDVTAQPTPAPNEAARQRIRDYFEKDYDAEVGRFHALRLSTRRRKWVVGLIGGTLLAATASAAFGTSRGLDWLAGMALYEFAAGILAFALIIAALAMKTIEELPPRENVEVEIDRLRDDECAKRIRHANKLLTAPAIAPTDFEIVLPGYPDKQIVDDLGFTRLARIGRDGTIRFTPIKVTAIKLATTSLAIYEGTIDLISGELLSERLLETPYRNITAIERSSQTLPATERREKRKLLRRILPTKTPMDWRDKDTISLQLAHNQIIQIVLRDLAFTDTLKSETVKAAHLHLSAPHERVEAFWQSLRARWHATQGTGSPSIFRQNGHRPDAENPTQQDLAPGA